LAEVIELEFRISVIVIYLLFVIWDLDLFTDKNFLFDQSGRLRPEAVLNVVPETLCAQLRRSRQATRFKNDMTLF